MTLPAFQAAGTGSETAPAWPTHSAGHFGLLFVECQGGTIATPTGWTKVNGFPVDGGSTILTIFYRFATSGSETAPSLSGGSGHMWGAILTYTGVNTSNPIHYVSPGTTRSSTLQNAPGVTTYLNDCLVVSAWAWAADSASQTTSLLTNASLGGLTERYNAGTVTGDGGGVLVVDGTLATKGTTNFTDVTFAVASNCATAAIALQAADKTFGQKSRIVNNRSHVMAILCNQSTAQEFSFFMADSVDGKTGKTGLTLAVTLKKGAESSFSSISPTVTEIGSGQYTAALTTTHMNTLGLASLRATATGADPADCPNAIDVVAMDKQSATKGFAGTNLDAAVTSRLAPTTAGRTLDVTATGGAGIDWSNVENPTTTLDLSGTSTKALEPVTAGRKLGVGTDNAAQADILKVSGDSTAADNLELQFDGTGLTGGTFPATQASITTLSSDAAAGLASVQSDTDDIQSKIGTPAGVSVSADIASVAAYIDTEIASIIATLATLATSAALSTAQTAITAIKAKTDQLAFTIANQVNANALTGGGGMALNDLLGYEYAPNRTVVGLFRRWGAMIESGRGFKGSLVEWLDDLGNVIWSFAQNTVNGTRSNVDVGDTEDPP